MPNPVGLRKSKGLFRYTLDQLMLVDALRFEVAALRYAYSVFLRRRLRTYRSDEGAAPIGKNTVSHNLKGLKDLAVNRSLTLLRPLSVIESLGPRSRILSIGPRTEGEILNLMALGFSRECITALDLISYSPWVQLGDMHQLPFAADTFDAVTLGWVLAYSNDPAKAAREVVRVVKPGGVVAVGVEYNPLTQEEVRSQLGYTPGGERRIESCEQILGLFEPHVDHLYFNHSIPESRCDLKGSLAVIFSVRK